MERSEKKPRWQRILELEDQAKKVEPIVGVSPLLTCRGQGGNLDLFEDALVIRRGLIWGLFFQKGIKGEKRIPFASISAVQFKRPNFLVGFIQFTIAGGVEDRRGIIGSAEDENTIQFLSAIEFDKARTFIEEKLSSRDQSNVRVSSATITVAEQLEKLALLLDRGLLTIDEFNAEKTALLAHK